MNLFFNEIVNEKNNRCALSIKCTRTVPAWVLTHACDELVKDLEKLSIIDNMIKIMEAYNIPLENFAIMRNEIRTFNARNVNEDITPFRNTKEFQNKIYYFIKDNKVNENFSNTFSYKHRPLVLVLKDDFWFPIYNYTFNSSVVLKSISVNSPAIITILTSLSIAIGIILSLKKDEREEKLTNAQIKYYNSAAEKEDAERRLAEEKLHKLINDPNVPSEAKAYLRNNALTLQNNIKNKLNQNLGENIIHFDGFC